MSKRFVRVISAIWLIAMAATCFVGCGKTDEEKTFPEYDTGKSFYIAGWGTPYATADDFRLAKEAGFSHFIVSETYSQSGTFTAQETLDFNKDAGMTSVMHIGNHYNSELEKPNTDYTNFEEYTDRICYSDEPVFSDYATLKQWAKEHDETYGNKFAYYVNLLSAAARTSELGDTEKTQTYENYVGRFCEDVLGEIKTGEKILSCDFYPIVESRGRTAIKTQWLYTLETLMYNAKQHNAKHEEFIQVVAHTNGNDTFPIATEESIRYQAYVLLNFETSGFTYFTYSSPVANYKNSCINLDKSQSLNDQYYYVKTVNAEIRAFEDIYLNYSVDGVMPVYGTENDYDVDEETGEILGNTVMRMMKKSVKKIDGVKSVTAEEDTLVSGMTDKDGNKALLITNFSNPYDGLYNTVDLTFEKSKKYTRLAVFRKGERKVYEIKDNKISLELEPGEGVFAMPA